jgi:hypothetical protein
VASGLSLNFHYCGGKLKDISFFQVGDKEKGCCGSKKRSKGCCNNKSTILKIEDDHRSSLDFKLPANNFISLNYTLPQHTLLLSKTFGELICPNYHAPPLLNKPPIYLNHRVLII